MDPRAVRPRRGVVKARVRFTQQPPPAPPPTPQPAVPPGAAPRQADPPSPKPRRTVPAWTLAPAALIPLAVDLLIRLVF